LFGGDVKKWPVFRGTGFLRVRFREVSLYICSQPQYWGEGTYLYVRIYIVMENFFFPADIPSTTTVPPLTPGTTQKMSQAVHESFKTFEREQQKYSISNGKYSCTYSYRQSFHKKKNLSYMQIYGCGRHSI
jgi:hypothetical protein